MVEVIHLKMEHYSLGIIVNILFGLILTVKLIILISILSKFNMSTTALNSLTYPANFIGTAVIYSIPTYFENKKITYYLLKVH